MTTSLLFSSTRVRLLSAALIAGGLIAAPASAASAAAPHSSTTAGQSCWQDLDTGSVECFDSSIDPIDYIEEATGGPVIAEESGVASGERRAVDATYLLTTLFDQIGVAGESMSYTTANASICSGTSHVVLNLREWDNRARSLQSFNGCRTTLYSEINTGGSAVGPFVSNNDLGAFRDMASSLFIAA